MPQIDPKTAKSTCRALLQPVVSFLLRCGLTWRDFAAIARQSFVEVATREYGIGGRPTNISRVAILTGIGRKDVRRLREASQTGADLAADRTPGTTAVLSGWHQDKDFLTRSGKPRVLSTDAGKHSFLTLCERYGGDIPPGAMLKELIRVGAVRQSDHSLKAVSRYYMPTHSDPQWISNAASVFQDLGNNLNFNLASADDEPSRFVGRATNTRIPENRISEFREFLEHNGQEFLEKVDDWLSANAVDDETDTQTVRLGIGLFAIQGDSDNQQR